MTPQPGLMHYDDVVRRAEFLGAETRDLRKKFYALREAVADLALKMEAETDYYEAPPRNQDAKDLFKILDAHR